jgi:hypothetical protein
MRTGYGWSIGGVDGNQNANGAINFISVSEVIVSGVLVPEPGALAWAGVLVMTVAIRRKPRVAGVRAVRGAS